MTLSLISLDGGSSNLETIIKYFAKERGCDFTKYCATENYPSDLGIFRFRRHMEFFRNVK